MKYCEFSGDIEKEIEKLWETNTRPVSLYLNNPFCRTENNCHYCVHRGCPTSKHNEEEVQKFYFEYMPMLLKHYENVINKQDIKLVNFGGGTPNYLSAKDFDRYLSLLPSKLINVHKIIELHPAYLTKEFLDVLKKYNFTTVIFCFQTFDTDMLNKQGRTIANLNNSKELVKYAKELGFNVGSDIITYWTKYSTDWAILEKDLQILKEMDMDEITISVLYQNKYNDEFEAAEVYRNIGRIVRRIIPEYKNPENTLVENFNVVTTRMFKPDSAIREDFEIYINSLTDITWEHEQGYSTLGLGSYKNQDKAVFSVIGPDVTLYEKFEDWDKIPTYYKTKNWNFWEAARNVIDALEETYKGKNPPVGANVLLTNIAVNNNLFYDHFIQGNCEFQITPRHSLKKTQFEIEKDTEFCSTIVDKNFISEYNTKYKKEKSNE